MTTDTIETANAEGRAAVEDGPVGGPVRSAWREGTLTRANEIEALAAWAARQASSDGHTSDPELTAAVQQHVCAAREAANRTRVLRRPSTWLIDVASLERASSNLDAAEALLLTLAPAPYLLGQVPSVLNHVQRHLPEDDARRREVERIAKKLGVNEPLSGNQTPEDQLKDIEHHRGKLISAVRAASSAALREQLRVRSFRNVLVAAASVLTLLAIGLAVMGWRSPTSVPLCFQPERSGQTVVVCPTQQSALLPTAQGAGPADPDVDDTVKRTASPGDVLVVELVGLTAAAVAAAAAIRGIRGSSEPHHLPVALAVLKLPTGAITAFLGIVLMRGQFVPGLTALDTSAQILAWALVFGYAQQLFTRLVDQQAQTVLDGVRAKKPAEPAVGAP